MVGLSRECVCLNTNVADRIYLVSKPTDAPTILPSQILRVSPQIDDMGARIFPGHMYLSPNKMVLILNHSFWPFVLSLFAYR
jgi:hypothetical protein